ncbi:hypothetical protein TI39_contig1052g00001 [Zymoseptoria brevis]|uniref:Uncharacterized protein n=1 Tax=Zymoseptoria brevis TaxID=1047168 RepID=A0A0F4GEI5_9PEZI|nr:hypothetical protein TI39_contig1052g00001 [Zymoseptoria brevis]
MPHVRQGEVSVESVALNAYGDLRDKTDICLFLAIRKQFSENQICAAAKRCIRAAMYSIEAFDGVPDRPIVTNIHGTAHAKFGKMLVLLAVYRCTCLNSMVPEARLIQLLERTIAFLRRLTPISPTCKADCGILEKLQHTMFGPSEHDGLESITMRTP